MLKKKYWEEINKLNYEELEYKIIALKKQLIFYQIKLATRQKIEPHKIKQTKKQIAQILTLNTLNKNKK